MSRRKDIQELALVIGAVGLSVLAVVWVLGS